MKEGIDRGKGWPKLRRGKGMDRQKWRRHERTAHGEGMTKWRRGCNLIYDVYIGEKGVNKILYFHKLLKIRFSSGNCIGTMGIRHSMPFTSSPIHSTISNSKPSQARRKPA